MNKKTLTRNWHHADNAPTEKAKPAARRGRKATGLKFVRDSRVAWINAIRFFLTLSHYLPREGIKRLL